MLSLGLGGHYYNLIRHCQYIHPDRHPDLHYLLFHLDHYHSTRVHSLGIHPDCQDNHHYHRPDLHNLELSPHHNHLDN